MIAIILIHTTYYFIGSSKIAAFIWNWAQFSVPVFIFCSAYLFFQKAKDLKLVSLNYFKKRLIRLLKPYYIFLLFFLPVFYLVEPLRLSPKYLWQSLIVAGGVDINWLVLLFIQLTIVFPLIAIFYNKNKMLFWLYSLVAFLGSIAIIFYKIPLNYKWSMWFFYSLTAIFAFLFVLYENKKWFRNISIFGSLFVFVLLYIFLLGEGRDLLLRNNKYPPNLFFSSFGIFMISLLYFGFQKMSKNKYIDWIVSFFSIYSYPIYFIHYIILIGLTPFLDKFNWSFYSFSLAVLIPTILVQIGINKTASLLKQSS